MRPIARAVFLLLPLALLAGCMGPGVESGDAARGWVVWGYVGRGPTTAAAGEQVALVDPSGATRQTVTSNAMGKYALAYHPAGNYTLHVGSLSVPVSIGAADQRVDIDLLNPTGAMNYVSAAGYGASGAGQSGPSAAITPVPASEAAHRDPALAGAWSRTDTLSSGDASLSTRMSLVIQGDGTYTQTAGDSVGGGDGWSAESRGDDVVRGRWKTENGVVFVDPGTGWEPYARYYVEGGRLMFTFESGDKEIWYR